VRTRSARAGVDALHGSPPDRDHGGFERCGAPCRSPPVGSRAGQATCGPPRDGAQGDRRDERSAAVDHLKRPAGRRLGHAADARRRTSPEGWSPTRRRHSPRCDRGFDPHRRPSHADADHDHADHDHSSPYDSEHDHASAYDADHDHDHDDHDHYDDHDHDARWAADIRAMNGFGPTESSGALLWTCRAVDHRSCTEPSVGLEPTTPSLPWTHSSSSRVCVRRIRSGYVRLCGVISAELGTDFGTYRPKAQPPMELGDRRAQFVVPTRSSIVVMFAPARGLGTRSAAGSEREGTPMGVA
jgi:hypothetical protein